MSQQTNTYPRLVAWFYNSATGMFYKANDKEFATEILITDPKGEEILKGGQVACLNTGSFSIYLKDPYFKRVRVDGYTARARNHGKIRRDLEQRYPDQKETLTRINREVKPYGDYVFINLAYLDNFANPMIHDVEFYSENFVYAKRFNKKFVEKLLDFKPKDMFHNEIREYQQEEVPKLLDALRFEFPELYKELVESNERVREFDEKFTFNGKKAKVKTLKSGRVELSFSILDSAIFEWDGEFLRNKVTVTDGSEVEQIIKPSDETVVTIVSDEGVTPETMFIS